MPLDPAPVGDVVNLEQLAEQMHLPLVHEPQHGVWAVGPESIGARALASAQAANLMLPDINGDTFELDSLRGTKVLLVAWSPY